MLPYKQAKERLLSLLEMYSYEQRHIVLSSGKESDFFIDCKQTVLQVEGAWLAGVTLAKLLREMHPGRLEAVAGVELGGCPLATATSFVLSFGDSLIYYGLCGATHTRALYVRKARKGHGTDEMVEGLRSLRVGAEVALVEDVVTTGASALRAVTALHAAGLSVVGIAALVDRQEGGAEAIREAGVPFAAVLTKQDFLDRTQQNRAGVL